MNALTLVKPVTTGNPTMNVQGSEGWFADRLGKASASRMADLMAKAKGARGATSKNYMMELLCQRLTGNREDHYTNAQMLRGVELEPVARSFYEIVSDVSVEETGFILHPTIEDLGASPDGLVSTEGCIEIKCPNTAQHVAVINSGEPDSKYLKQMNTQMLCADRQWCDFISFDDRMPEPLQLVVYRVERDEELIKQILEETESFLKELDALEASMLEKMEAAA